MKLSLAAKLALVGGTLVTGSGIWILGTAVPYIILAIGALMMLYAGILYMEKL